MVQVRPHGYHPTASGLLVPEAHARVREVWTRDEWRILERATKFLSSKDLAIFLGCRASTCREAPLERRRNPDGGLTLRCDHKDRVILLGV